MTPDTQSETPLVERLRSEAPPLFARDILLRREAADALTAQAQEIAELRQREAGMREQHDRDSAELRRLCAERDEARRKAAELREKVERLQTRATEYNDLPSAIEGATVTHTLPMPAQQPAK